MSTITTILRMQERVSGPIRTVISSLQSAGSAFRGLRAASANAIDTGAISQARGSLDGMRQAVNEADAAFDGLRAASANAIDPGAVARMQGSLEQMRRSVDGADAAFDRLHRASANAVNSGAMSRTRGILERVRQAVLGTGAAFRGLRSASAKAIDTGAMSRARASLDEIQQSVDGIDDGFDNVSKSVRKAAEEQGRFNRHLQTGSDTAGRLLSAIRGMVGAYIGLNAVKGFVALSDTLTQTTARLNMLTGGMDETRALQDAIFASAQRSRGAYQDSADAVAKMGLLAGNAFTDTGELVKFTELINKEFTIAGTSADGVKAAMLQLTQAMGSGVLRGEELNSILEQAPNIVHTIAEHLGVGVGQIRQMAADGEITAQVVKDAMLGSADKINRQFESMPMTWSQAWTSISNTAIRALEPALNKLNAFLSTNSGQAMIQGLTVSVLFLGQVVESVVDAFQRGADFVVANWNIIGPLLIGGTIAVGAAFLWAGVQAGAAWIAATWPFLLLVGLLGALILGLQEAGVSWVKMGQIAGAVIAGIYAVLYDLVASAWDLLAAFAEFFANVWRDPVGSVVRLFAGMADAVLGLLQTIANAIDAIFGSNLSGAVAGWRSSLSGAVTAAFGEGRVKVPRMEQKDIRATVMQGYQAGGDMVSGFAGMTGKITKAIGDYQGVPLASIVSGVDDIAGKTGDIANGMDFAEEDLKYLRDLAEQDVINRFTTAEIKVDMGGIVNQVASHVDLDGIMDYMVGGVYDAMEMAAEGVHA